MWQSNDRGRGGERAGVYKGEGLGGKEERNKVCYHWRSKDKTSDCHKCPKAIIHAMERVNLLNCF